MKTLPKWPWLAIAWIKSFQHYFLVIHVLYWATLSYVQATTVATNMSQNLRNVKYVDGTLFVTKESIESSLQTIHDISTENLGTLCLTQLFRPLKAPLNVERWDGVRQKADLAAIVLQDVGVSSRHVGLLDALAKGLLSDSHVTSARVLGTNYSSGVIINSVWWSKKVGGIGDPIRIEEEGVAVGVKPDSNYPWFEDEESTPNLRSPKFIPSPLNASFRGWWTYPYYSCPLRRWILSYSVAIPPVGRHGMRGFLSIDIDVTDLQVNQCEPASTGIIDQTTDIVSPPTPSPYPALMTIAHITTTTGRALSNFHGTRHQAARGVDHFSQIEVFHGSHKCHLDSMQCEYRLPETSSINKNSVFAPNGWTRGSYQCLCRAGFYSGPHPAGFNGTIMEAAYEEFRDNISTFYVNEFRCYACAQGCTHCTGPAPCLASYNWPFRVTLLTFSILCAVFTVLLALYLFQHRKVKVFKVASPIFLTITLFGCATMYLEMAAIFPILDTYACIATKWTRHMGFCITYTALLMKTWRVSLTYRVKSAHKVKLTDKQLLQWMVPILLVMLIYLGTWTLSAPPNAEKITDQYGLIFKQCSYNWWDHSLAIGEVIFLAWGIRVCYNVRNAESLYNEAKLISYAIYNIALVNTTMVAFHLLIFPQAGPDIKYLLGFIRTQLSTSVTMALVFGPKMFRVLRGQGDQCDNRARVRGITASFSLNGVGLVAEETADLYQENEELKEEIQKLAAQIEFMKIVHMEINNRHLKPKPGGYFTMQSPMGKNFSTRAQKSRKSKPLQPQQLTQLITTKDYETKIEPKKSAPPLSDDGHSGTNSGSGGDKLSVENVSDTGASTVISNPTNVPDPPESEPAPAIPTGEAETV